MEDLTLQPIITLHDAITDSPVFRSNLYRQDIQLEQLEQWLTSLARQIKLYAEKLSKFNLETMSLCQMALPKDMDETLIDSNFTGAVMKSFVDAVLTSLSFKTKMISDLEEHLITPLQQFVKTHLRDFKNFKKQFVKVMEKYEVQLAKYSALSKTKEPSAIREEAFRLHEARKEYVRMSGQHVLRILNFRSLLEHCLVERFSSVTLAHKNFYNDIQVWANLDAALSFWKQWLEDDKLTCAYQLQKQQLARKRLEDEYIRLMAPDHDIEKYIIPVSPKKVNLNLINSKWGYLFVKVSRHTWNRKWFFIHNGYFGICQVDTTGKQKHAIMCEARFKLLDLHIQPFVDSDRRFCFEVSQDQTSFILQAEKENDLQDWIRVFNLNKEESKSFIKSKSKMNSQLSIDTSTMHSSDNLVSLIEDSSLTLTRNLSDNGPSFVIVSTTPDHRITLSSSSSLTPLLVWEATHTTSFNKLPADSWGIPWSLMPIVSNAPQTPHTSTTFPKIIWPPKSTFEKMPKVELTNYNDDIDSYNKELRVLFGGVKPDEVVLDTFVCCLRKSGTDSSKEYIKEIEISKSSLGSTSADIYEKEFVQQLKQVESKPPSKYGYAYTGRSYITQDTFWFYSCVMTTCINSVVVRLKDIDEIKVIKDESLQHLTNNTALEMKSDMIISISLAPNARKENEEPIILGTLMENIEIVAEKLELAVKNAKSEELLSTQDLFNELQQLSIKSVPHKSVVLDLPLTFSKSVTPFSSIKPSSNTHLTTRMHAATVGQEAKVNIKNVLKTSLQRGESEPIISSKLPSVDIKKLEPPKPDPDMPPSHIQCPDGPVACNCGDHLERQDIQINLPISAKRLYELMFTDEQNAPPTDGGVWHGKTAGIDGHDLSVTKWDMVDDKMQRILKYWMPVANPIVRMKEAEVVETQVLINKEDYIRYTIQISTKTAALPYAEAFIPCVRYCITWVNKSECQLTCYLGVKWVQKVLVRAIVTRSALKGMSDSVGVFVPVLKAAADKIKESVDQSRKEVIQYNNNLLSQNNIEIETNDLVIESNDTNTNQETLTTKVSTTQETTSVSSSSGSSKATTQVQPMTLDKLSESQTAQKNNTSLPILRTNTAATTSSNSTASTLAVTTATKSTAVIPTITSSTTTTSSSDHSKQKPRSIEKVSKHKILKTCEPWLHTVRTFATENLIIVLIIFVTVFMLYNAIIWFSSGVSDSSRYNNLTTPNLIKHEGSSKIPFKKSSSRLVYLRDLDEGFLHNHIQPPFAKSKSYSVFLKMKQLGHSENENESIPYDHQWFTMDHYHLALDLNVSRERIAMLRHDLLTVFQVLNTLDLKMVENEYMNWLLDTQLKCNHSPPSQEDPRAEQILDLCQDVSQQLGRYF